MDVVHGVLFELSFFSSWGRGRRRSRPWSLPLPSPIMGIRAFTRARADRLRFAVAGECQEPPYLYHVGSAYLYHCNLCLSLLRWLYVGWFYLLRLVLGKWAGVLSLLLRVMYDLANVLGRCHSNGAVAHARFPFLIGQIDGSPFEASVCWDWLSTSAGATSSPCGRMMVNLHGSPRIASNWTVLYRQASAAFVGSCLL